MTDDWPKSAVSTKIRMVLPANSFKSVEKSAQRGEQSAPPPPMTSSSVVSVSSAKIFTLKKSTASAFFRQKFKGHGKYKATCTDAARLAAALKLLNGEFAPHLLYEPATAERCVVSDTTDERDEE